MLLRRDALAADAAARSDVQDPAPVLVAAFLEAARGALAPLLSGPEATLESGVQVWERGTPRLISPEDGIPWPFWAVARFRGAEVQGELTYGDRELFVNAIVAPSGGDTQAAYALWEWVAALGGADAHASEASFVQTAQRLRRVVAERGATLRAWASQIAAAGPEVVALIEAVRAERQAAWEAQESAAAHRRAAARAAEAFRAGEYRPVVDLLTPLGARLSDAERRTLELARRRLR